MSKQTLSSSDSDKAPDTKENEVTTLTGSTHEAKRKQLHPNKVRVLIGAFFFFSIKVFKYLKPIPRDVVFLRFPIFAVKLDCVLHMGKKELKEKRPNLTIKEKSLIVCIVFWFHN